MATDLNPPAAVFFDWDGTLVDSFGFLHAAHNHTRAQFGMGPFSLEEFGGYFGQPREKLYAEIYGPENIEEAKGHFESYVYANHMNLKTIPYAAEILETLHERGIPCGVVTNKKRALVEVEIKNYGWEHYFTSVVGAGEAEADKPSSAPLLMAIEQANLNLNIEEVWYVGDTDNDIICANEAGCVTILIASEEDAADLLAKYEVHLHKKNCSEFLEFLLQNGAKLLKKV